MSDVARAVDLTRPSARETPGAAPPTQRAVVHVRVGQTDDFDPLAAGAHSASGKNFGASRWMMFRDIALPAALPMIVAGMRLGMGVALPIIVTAESLAAKSGIGYLIWTIWQVFQVEKMYVGV